MRRMNDETSFPAPAETAPEATGERIERFTLAELEAMRGKRGRKPAEFYQAFPDAAPAAKPAAEKAPKAARTPRAAKAAQVSSAVLGEHTIDELLEMIGSTGKKPVAYGILRDSAQVFVDRGAVDLPAGAGDPLAALLANAPARVREVVAELLHQAGVKPAARVRKAAPVEEAAAPAEPQAEAAAEA
jgi:hypothetical protein